MIPVRIKPKATIIIFINKIKRKKLKKNKTLNKNKKNTINKQINLLQFDTLHYIHMYTTAKIYKIRSNV